MQAPSHTHAQAANSGYTYPSIPSSSNRSKGTERSCEGRQAGRQALYHGLHGCGCSLLVVVVLAQHLGLLLGTQPLQGQVRRRLSQLPSQQHVLRQACQHIRIHRNALTAISEHNQPTHTHTHTHTQACAASTESAGVNHQELYRSWHPENYHL